jgi:hypothetical protein
VMADQRVKIKYGGRKTVNLSTLPGP